LIIEGRRVAGAKGPSCATSPPTHILFTIDLVREACKGHGEWASRVMWDTPV